MNPLTDAEKDRLWEEVRAEFPGDEGMQEVHYVRLLHHQQLKGLPAGDRIAFFQSLEHAPVESFHGHKSSS